jgi:hypothetical protein
METTQNTNPLAALAQSVKNQKTCQCGCGHAVARRFLPGHDARLKSALVQSVSAKNWWERQAAAEALLQRGWLHFASVEALADLKVRSRAQRNGRWTETRHVEVVEAASHTHLDQRGVTHSHPNCQDVEGTLRMERGAGTGWLCSTCVHTEDWLEVAAQHNLHAWQVKQDKDAKVLGVLEVNEHNPANRLQVA